MFFYHYLSAYKYQYLCLDYVTFEYLILKVYWVAQNITLPFINMFMKNIVMDDHKIKTSINSENKNNNNRDDNNNSNNKTNKDAVFLVGFRYSAKLNS